MSEKVANSTSIIVDVYYPHISKEFRCKQGKHVRGGNLMINVPQYGCSVVPTP